MTEKPCVTLPTSVQGQSAYQVGRQAAAEAGKILRQRFGRHNATRVKGKRDLVTEADLLSEKIILEIITAAFPEHGIMSEEAGIRREGSEYTWIIDPLDGTNNYHYGIPLFCVNIALARRNEVLMGITFDPMRNEVFRAVRGKGAYLNNRRIRVADVTNLEDAAVGVDLGYDAERSKDLLETAMQLWPKIHCMRLIGSSSLGMAYVAGGRLSLYFHKSLYPWDSASGLLLVREAGGEVTDYSERPATFHDREIIAANPRLGRVFRDWLGQK
ncbi:MAG: inositol monophosphatase family protein [Dehalococcoidia bacterium]|nr:inositol monophosphatase family protein [Dehalococcoidia bacterium]